MALPLEHKDALRCGGETVDDHLRTSFVRYVNALDQSSPSAYRRIRYHRQANEHYQKWCWLDTGQRTVI